MRNFTSGADPEAADPEGIRFHKNLANGLHAMAQPLTILRSAMEILTRPSAATIDHRRYVEISARQVARACGMFASLQDLVETQLIEAQQTRFNLWDRLLPVIDDQRRMLEPAGVEIAVTRDETATDVRGDAGRTENALAAVLRLAGWVSGRGDVVELKALNADGYLQLTLENTRRHGKTMDSSDRLCLAVAEANILSQNGRCAVVEDPFRVSLALPIASLAEAVCEAKLSHVGLQPVGMN